jgi:hypothetical protein
MQHKNWNGTQNKQNKTTHIRITKQQYKEYIGTKAPYPGNIDNLIIECHKLVQNSYKEVMGFRKVSTSLHIRLTSEGRLADGEFYKQRKTWRGYKNYEEKLGYQ